MRVVPNLPKLKVLLLLYVSDSPSEVVKFGRQVDPVVIITCVHYLGPPGPSTSQILGTFSRFSEDLLGRERDPREDPLGSGRIP